MSARRSKLSPEIAEILKKAFPDGMVRMDFAASAEECYLKKIYPELRKQLASMEGCRIGFEHDPFLGAGRRKWEDVEGFDACDPKNFDPAYWQIFVECLGPDMRCSIEMDAENVEWEDSERTPEDEWAFGDVDGDEELDLDGEADEALEEEWVEHECEEPDASVLRGTAVAGCNVGISLIAPFALVEFDELDSYEDGSLDLPSVHSVGALDPDVSADDFGERLSEKAWNRLKELRECIVKNIDSCGIRVLSSKELETPVPFLRPDDGIIPGEDQVTLRSALFFETL